jgi:Zn-dependent M28 family amino/carboxypeptidase
LTGSEEASTWTSNWRRKAKTAYEKGAKAILIIDNSFKKNLQDFNKYLLSGGMRFGAGEFPEKNYANNLFISTEIAKKIMGKNYNKVIKARDEIKVSGKPINVKLKSKIELNQKKAVRQILGSNVLGFIEGIDEKLKNEVVVVTAHYDHLGKKGESIFNGADDNGSGTSSVLEVAEALVEAKAKGHGPRRSVLCMLVSGEEKGLLGSKYYAEFPIFPLENTVANVNVDMVGRVDEKHAGNPNYIYVIGSNRLSTDLHKINEAANKNFTNLELDYKYNDPKDPNRYYYRSDHYNFAEKGIPAIFYFSGTHVDYHKPSDTVEKINFDKMEKIAKLVFHTTWELANRDERIKVDVIGKN